MNSERYDVIIIGGGPTGLSAAIYTGRADLKTLILDKPEQILKKVENIENYPGFPEGISGRELLERGEKQAKKFGSDIVEEEALVARMKGDDGFVVEITDKQFEGDGLITAPGVKHEKPNIDGLEDFEGRGVSYCVMCDGPLYKDMALGVLGSKNYAAKEALDLYDFTRDVAIFTNGKEMEVDRGLREALEEKNTPIMNEKIERAFGGEKFEGLELESGREKLEGLFVAIGTSGATDFARSLGIPIEGDKIVDDENFWTGIPRVYAAGDCVGGARQLTKAVGEGTQAALNLIEELKGRKVVG